MSNINLKTIIDVRIKTLNDQILFLESLKREIGAEKMKGNPILTPTTEKRVVGAEIKVGVFDESKCIGSLDTDKEKNICNCEKCKARRRGEKVVVINGHEDIEKLPEEIKTALRGVIKKYL